MKLLLLEGGSECGLELARACLADGLDFVLADANPYSVATQFPEFRHMVPGEALGFTRAVLGLVRAEGITHVLPTFSAGINQVIRHRHEFSALGCELLLSPLQTQRFANDKASYAEFASFAHTKTAWAEDTPFAKLRFGKGSRGVALCRTQAEADAHASTVGGQPLVFQRYLSGNQYTVDVLTDVRTGEPRQAVVRSVVEWSRGTDAVATTHRQHALESVAMGCALQMGVRGIANFEFREDEEGVPWCIDANLRFSASHGMTVRSGFPLLQSLLEGTLRTPMWRGPFHITPQTYYRSLGYVVRSHTW